MIDSGTDQKRFDEESEKRDAASYAEPPVAESEPEQPKRRMNELLAIIGGAIGVLVLAAVFAASRWHHEPVAAVPSATAAPLVVAEAEARAGHATAANAAAARALSADPSSARTADGVAAVAHRTHNDALYESALWLSAVDAPQNWRTYALLGDYFVHRHRDGVAAKELKIGISMAPEAPGLHYKLAEIQRRHHLYRDALANYRNEPAGSPYYPAARRGAEHESAIVAARSAHKGGARQHRHGRNVIAKNHRGAHNGRRNAHPQRLAQQHRQPQRGAPQRPGGSHPDVASHPAPLIAGAHVGPAVVPRTLPAGLSNEARAFLTGATEDFSFTHALPQADAYRELSSASFDQQLSIQLASSRPNIDRLLRMGSAALEGGDTNSALQAFSAASSAAPHDWRGPYFAGLSEEANNDLDRATRLFQAAERRARRPEPLTSLALLQMRRRDVYGAERSIRQAIEIDPEYAPARFTEGVLALVRNDPPRAQEELSTTLELPWAPQRAAYFLNRLNDSRTVVKR